jgi:hypothetical protein
VSVFCRSHRAVAAGRGWRTGVGRYRRQSTRRKSRTKNMRKIVTEDDCNTFEGWLENIQGIDPTTAAPDVLADWRDLYAELTKNPAPKVGLMKLKLLMPGEHRYAVAIREGSDLWLTFSVRRAPKGDIFLMAPRADGRWNPH